MNPTDEQMLRQRLREHLGALPVRPAPLSTVTRQGRSIRARRGGMGVTAMAAVAGVVATVLAVSSLLPGGTHGRQVVTINTPDQRAPGGVFASGTANGTPWRLSVRNIALGTGCIPTVMLNGRAGDVLFGPGYPSSALLNTAFAAPRQIPGEPGVGYGFAQVRADVTRVELTVPGGERYSARPVTLTQCGERYRLAGFAYQGSRVTRLTAISGHGHSDQVPLPSSRTAGSLSAGTWANAGSQRPQAATPTIGSGLVKGASWWVTESLTPGGDCYAGHVSKGSSSSSSFECVPIAAPPAGMTGVNLTIQLSSAPGAPSFTAYAGLVSPGTTRVSVKLSDGTRHTYRPVPASGRKYVGFVLRARATLLQLTLYGAAGHVLRTYNSIPRAELGNSVVGQSGSSSASAPP